MKSKLRRTQTSAIEGYTENPLVFTFTRSGQYSSALTVYYTLSGTAEPGLDYSPQSVFDTVYSISIPGGGSSESAQVQMTAEADDLWEGDEHLTLSLRSNSSYWLGGSRSASGTIQDVAVNLAVDSNNDGQMDNTDEAVEVQAPGVFVFYNGNSLDGDTIADLNDGYDADGSAGFNADDQCSPTQFSQVKLTLPDWVDWSTATIQFTPSSGLNLWTSNQTMRAVEQKVDPQKAYHPWELGIGNGADSGTFWLEGIAGSQSLGDQQLKVDVTNGSKDAGQDTVKATVPRVDLQVLKKDGSPLSESQEQTSGGYVAKNNDDDNWDRHPDSDLFVEDPAAGEDDLVAIKLKAQSLPLGGVYRIKYTSENIRVFTQADMGGPIVLSNHDDFSVTQDTTLYVEGLSVSPEVGKEQITLEWQVTGHAIASDVINLTVYEVVGPMNVPDYSRESYFVRQPGPPSLNFSIEGGSIWFKDFTSEGSYANVKWDGGPAVGHIVYSPADGFEMDCKVNIVQVLIESPDDGPAFQSSGNHLIGGVLPKHPPNNNSLFMAYEPDQIPPKGMKARAKITLVGPNGRGVDRIVVGFVQNVLLYHNHGKYVSGKTLVSNKDGIGPVLDQIGDDGNAWAIDDGVKGTFYGNNTATAAMLEFNDMGPRVIMPITFDQGDNLAADDDFLQIAYSDHLFQLDICAATRDEPILHLPIHYTRRATAVWRFNGNLSVGRLENGMWAFADYPEQGQNIEAGIHIPNAWQPVEDGSQPPVTDGPSFNSTLAARGESRLSTGI